MSSEYGDDDTFFTEDIMRQMDEKELEYTQTQGMSTLTKEFASAVLHSQTRYIASSADYIPPPIATSASATSEEERRIKAQQFTIDRMQGKMAVIQAQKETADKLSDEYIAKCNFQEEEMNRLRQKLRLAETQLKNIQKQPEKVVEKIPEKIPEARRAKVGGNRFPDTSVFSSVQPVKYRRVEVTPRETKPPHTIVRIPDTKDSISNSTVSNESSCNAVDMNDLRDIMRDISTYGLPDKDPIEEYKDFIDCITRSVKSEWRHRDVVIITDLGPDISAEHACQLLYESLKPASASASMQYKLDQLAQTIHQNVIDYHSSKKEETIKKILDISKSAIRLSVQEELNNVIAAYLELVQCLTSHYTIATSYLATEAEKDKDSLIHLLSDLTEIFSTNDEDPMGNHVDLVPLRERSRSMSVDDFTEQLSSISEENIPTKDTLHIVSGRIIQYIMCIFDSMRYVSYTPNLK